MLDHIGNKSKTRRSVSGEKCMGDQPVRWCGHPLSLHVPSHVPRAKASWPCRSCRTLGRLLLKFVPSWAKWRKTERRRASELRVSRVGESCQISPSSLVPITRLSASVNQLFSTGRISLWFIWSNLGLPLFGKRILRARYTSLMIAIAQPARINGTDCSFQS